MYGLRQEITPPSGVEHAVFLKLTPSSLDASPSSLRKVLNNLVVARSSLLRIFEVVEEPAPLPSLEEAEERARAGTSKLGTEAVEGEVEMDEGGEGFVNMAKVKTLPAGASITPTTVTRLHLLREHRLHGSITGLGVVKTITTSEDGLDRLVISFRDAKISLMEWSDVVYDLMTVSIHTYERAPQVLSTDSSTWRAKLRMDPSYRCAALSLPKDAFAILPFHTPAEIDMVDNERGFAKDIPYSPSFVLDLREIDQRIKNVLDYTFVPGFNNPTLAIAFQGVQTWTGRLNEYKDTVAIFFITIDTITRSYPIISQVENMPFDTMYIVPSPPSLGGLFLVTPNSIVHVDQTSRTVGIAVNGWANRVSASSLPVQVDEETNSPLDLRLEGSTLAFIREDSVLLFLADGTIRRVTVEMEGRIISRLAVTDVIAQTSPASVLAIAPVSSDEQIFVGSVAGPSVLVRVTHVEEVVEKVKPQLAAPQDDLDMELDEEIYGDIATQAMADRTAGPDVETITTLRFALRDCLPGHGIISHMTFGVSTQEDRPSPELIACTGVGHLSGFTRFTKHLPTRTKRKVPAIGGAQGVWSMFVKRASNSKMDRSNADVRDTIIISTNAAPAPGLSRVITTTSNGDVTILSRATGVTITAAPFFQNTRFVQVMNDRLRLMGGDGTERLVVKDVDASGQAQAKIIAACVSDPFVLVRREDDTVALFVGDTMTGKIVRSDRFDFPHCSGISIYTDRTGVFHLEKGSASAPDSLGATEELENILDSNRGTSWLALLLVTGEMQILSLPDLRIVFSTPSLSSLPLLAIHDSTSTMSSDADSLKDATRIIQFCIAPIGDSICPKPYLIVLTQDQLVAAYEISIAPRSLKTTSALPIRLVKTFSRLLEEPPSDLYSPRSLITFELDGGEIPLSGVFCTGHNPFWLLSRRWSPLHLYPAAHPIAHAFTPCSMLSDRGDFLLYSDEGPALMQWVGDVQLGLDLPYRDIRVGRQYTAVIFDPATQHIVAVSTQKSSFVLFDDEGKRLWTPDTPGVSDPVCESSSLELISPDTWTSIDGYEFEQNEFVNTAESVSLETLSAEKGQKDFIVVGTTIYRGEDLAVKGATYIFEVVEVVREPGSLKRRNKLKLLCRDEAKGPVTAVCGMNGYLVSSMGQKVYVRAFDLDERLIGMAFLDVGLYVTSLATLKNLLLISDAVKGVWFACFQEDPFKLIVLSKDSEAPPISNANFFFDEGGEMAFVTTDENGVRLLCRTEFDGQEEHKTVLTVARRPAQAEEDDIAREEIVATQVQSALVCATLEASISILAPVDSTMYKRLALLQGQLVRNVQHVAALNPKGYRTVPNDKVSRPLTKGILDGCFLTAFVDLPVERQIGVTKQIGTEPTVILSDLRELWRTW
ncbi:mRNA cleavage and polyadenylation factor subunit [Tulasnella sp. 403]|nr:mRNA cleavage and polyadenylation factor subunit [Tulasnella sp. 403]